jgi:hypothetical protein
MCVTCNSLGVVGGGRHKSLEPFPEVGDTEGGNASLVYQRGKSGLHYQHCETGYQRCETGPWAAAVCALSRAEVADEAMPPWLGAPCLLVSSSYPQPRGALATCASAWRRSRNSNGRELLLPVVVVQGRAPFAA